MVSDVKFHEGIGGVVFRQLWHKFDISWRNVQNEDVKVK